VIQGGAIHARKSTIVVDDCIVTSNTGFNGVGIHCSYSSAEIVGNTISDNISPSGEGAGVLCGDTTYAVVDGNVVTGNLVSQGCCKKGGGVYFSGYSSGAVTNNLIKGNRAYQGGGITCHNSSSPTIANCTIVDNTGNYGGGIYVEQSTPIISNNIVAYNTGAGIRGLNPTLLCNNFIGNSGGDYELASPGTGDFSDDPEFCDAIGGDYHLASTSPCLYGPCGQVGAYGQGCFGEWARIMDISDVGNDQGRQVRLKWQRSLYDAAGDTIDITGYALYRREDEYLKAANPKRDAIRHGPPLLGATQLIGWDYVATVLARGDSLYQFVAPTLCDSTDEGMCLSVFFVSALTPDPLIYFDSDPDSGYSMDNLAPAPPPNFRMDSEVLLAWDEAEEPDFDYFTVYGSANPEHDGSAVFIGYTIGTTLDITGHVYDYYHVTATDFSGNEGDASSLGNVYAGILQDRELPTAFALRPNRPNPFAGETTIRFDLPRPIRVSLAIFDTNGRLVRTLVQEDYPGGRHALVWPGDDEKGNPVAPGTYFARMQAGDFLSMRKVVLLR
jgi:hypothetical protein